MLRMAPGDSDASDDNYEEDDDEGSGSGAATGGEDGSSGLALPTAGDSPGVAGDSEAELYDIALASTHSYMSAGLVAVAGRAVLEPGWRGRVPAAMRHGCVFPGETVPMRLHAADAAVLARVIKQDRLFGLLCPDETGYMISGYGVLCEVYEAGPEVAGQSPEYNPSHITFKARAIHRFRFTHQQKPSNYRIIDRLSINNFRRMQYVDVTVLPEIATCETLRAARLHSLAPRLSSGRAGEGCAAGAGGAARRARRLEAGATPWPLFVHDIFDYQRMRTTLRDYFKTIMLDKLPEEPVSLSFWVASNMALPARDRLALFKVDNALQRLRMACRFAKRKSVLCCSECWTEIARKENLLPMSSEGVHSNYVNPGGHMHDLLTVSQTTHTVLHGRPTAEFSWFPGYSWTIMNCAHCETHAGWRFEALKSTLRPQHFFGLSHHIQPCSGRRPPRAASPAPPRRSPDLEVDALLYYDAEQ